MPDFYYALKKRDVSTVLFRRSFIGGIDEKITRYKEVEESIGFKRNWRSNENETLFT